MVLSDLLGQPLGFWLYIIGSLCALAVSLALQTMRIRRDSREATRMVHERMRTLMRMGDSADNHTTTDILERWAAPVFRTAPGKRLRDWSLRAQPEVKPSRTLVLFIALFLLGLLIGLFFHALLSGLVIALLAVGGFAYLLQRRTIAESQTFIEQLPDVFLTLATAQRAGQSLTQAITFVALQLRDPAAREFRRVADDIRSGIDLRQALERLLRRRYSTDLELGISAILIQNRIGGNLAAVLESLANTIRTRRKIDREIRIITQQVRSTTYIVGALVPGLALILSLENPGYLDPLFQPGLGLLLLLLAVTGDVIGIVWTWRIVRVSY